MGGGKIMLNPVNLEDKKGLVVSIANEHSIAYGCAKFFYDCGAENRFDELLERAAARTPKRQLVSIEDVGALAAFPISAQAKAITGGVHYIDGGYNIVG